ncbi:MAG: hypothetical protein IKU94_02335 [Bacteroidaceae bacterium]|nr:hypothetical protein [Bacteroidaceae bacterium]
MYLTREQFEALREKYSNLLIMDHDVRDALNFAHDLLAAEADALQAREPSATVTIDRLNKAAYEVFDICQNVERESFSEV